MSPIIFLFSGVTARLSDTNTSCVGQEVTYTCTIQSTSHAWTLHTLPNPLTTAITRATPEDTRPPYSFQTVSDDGNTIITSVTVTAFPELNGTIISCVDGNAPTGQGDMQETTAMVFGKSLIVRICTEELGVMVSLIHITMHATYVFILYFLPLSY